jgi:hypothetical protein
VSLSIYIFVTPLAHNDDGAALSPLCYYINIYIYNDGLAGFGATTDDESYNNMREKLRGVALRIGRTLRVV